MSFTSIIINKKTYFCKMKFLQYLIFFILFSNLNSFSNNRIEKKVIKEIHLSFNIQKYNKTEILLKSNDLLNVKSMFNTGNFFKILSKFIFTHNASSFNLCPLHFSQFDSLWY